MTVNFLSFLADPEENLEDFNHLFFHSWRRHLFHLLPRLFGILPREDMGKSDEKGKNLFL